MSVQFSDTHSDVGGRRRPECRKTGLTMSADDTRRHSPTFRPTSAADVGVNVGKLDQKMLAADVGRRHPPSCRSWSLLFHYSFFATSHYMLLFTSTQLYVTHLLSLPPIHSHPLTVDSYLSMNSCGKIRAVPAARTRDLPLTQLALYHLTACVPCIGNTLFQYIQMYFFATIQ